MPFTPSAEATYASKPNLAFPGSAAQATAAEALAKTRIDEVLAAGGQTGLAVTIAASTVKVALP